MNVPVPLRLAALSVLALLVAAALPVRAAEVQRIVADNGVEAWLVEDHANPVISVKLAVPGGAVTDPKGKAGLANMATSLLDEGAGDMDSQSFQEKLAQKAIKLSFNASSDHVYGNLRTLTAHKDTAARLLSTALSEPRFDPEPVARIRSQILASIASKSTRPSWRANRALEQVLFGDHPYANAVTGHPKTVKAITAGDLHRFAERRFARERLIVGVAGDITPEALKIWLDKAFGTLPETGGALPEVSEAKVEGGGAQIVIEQNVPQSWVAFGQAGLKRDDPDYYAAKLVNYVLGGGSFASRLFEEVREKRGLVYSVYSYLNPLKHAATYGGGLGTSNARVGKAVSVVRAEWRRMAENGPTAEELADAKTHLTGSFPLKLSSTKKIASVLAAMQREGLGINYMDKREDLIESVTLKDAKRVARDLVAPENLAFVVVGQPEGFKANRPVPDTAEPEG